MKKGGGSESSIIVGPSKSVLVNALQSLEYVLGLARFRMFVPKLLLLLSEENRKNSRKMLFLTFPGFLSINATALFSFSMGFVGNT